jgi:hypothetical protein
VSSFIVTGDSSATLGSADQTWQALKEVTGFISSRLMAIVNSLWISVRQPTFEIFQKMRNLSVPIVATKNRSSKNRSNKNACKNCECIRSFAI